MGRTQAWSMANGEFRDRFSRLVGNRLAMSEKTVQQIAAEAGVSESTLYKYRAGTTPSMFEGLKILKAVGVESLSLSELV